MNNFMHCKLDSVGPITSVNAFTWYSIIHYSSINDRVAGKVMFSQASVCPRGQTPPPSPRNEMATSAVGTHLTEMHSC